MAKAKVKKETYATYTSFSLGDVTAWMNQTSGNGYKLKSLVYYKEGGNVCSSFYLAVMELN